MTTCVADKSASGALDVMAKLAILIIAALLFAGYGIRDGRGQTTATPTWKAKAQGKPERIASMRRMIPDRTRAAAEQAMP